MGAAFEECLKVEKANKAPVFEILDTQEEIQAQASAAHYTTPERVGKLPEDEQLSSEKFPEGCKRKLPLSHEVDGGKRLRKMDSAELREISAKFSHLGLGSPNTACKSVQSPVAAAPAVLPETVVEPAQSPVAAAPELLPAEPAHSPVAAAPEVLPETVAEPVHPPVAPAPAVMPPAHQPSRSGSRSEITAASTPAVPAGPEGKMEEAKGWQEGFQAMGLG